MWQIPPWIVGRKALAVAALLVCATSGCGGDGPTGPGLEPEAISLSGLFGNQLYRADGGQVGVEVLIQIPVIGIYFSDPGCAACAGFTPVLVGAYNQLRAEGRSFEVVLVPLGVSQASLFDYMVNSGMPWLAVSPRSSEANSLLQRYQVQWIPTLVIIDGSGNTISLNGREELVESGPSAYDAWLATSTGG
jgi:hypothetical protein